MTIELQLISLAQKVADMYSNKFTRAEYEALCNCYLGCIAERSTVPQDMEIQEDNIPKFIEVLENCITNKIDFETIFEFWKESMCY